MLCMLCYQPINKPTLLTFGAVFFLCEIPEFFLDVVQFSVHFQDNILQFLVRSSVEAVVIINVTWHPFST